MQVFCSTATGQMSMPTDQILMTWAFRLTFHRMSFIQDFEATAFKS